MDIDSNSGGAAATRALVPTPHDVLWFPDGNVVLATDKYLFRLHKGMLSLHSSVFKDMFELPTVDASGSSAGGENTAAGMTPDSELHEGLPLVRLAGDNGDDVVHLLRAAFERRCVVQGHPSTRLEDSPFLLADITSAMMIIRLSMLSPPCCC